MDLFRAADPTPDDADDAAAPETPGRPRPLTVTRLNERIRGALQRGLPATILVRGEISNLSRRNHWYFSLKDDGSAVSCVSFRSDVRKFDATLTNGDEVIATGRVDHWVAGGRTQMYVTGLERAGRGTLQQQYEALVRELRGLGWFDEDRKRPLPLMPRRIAVITSATGAAIHDVRKTVEHRLPAVGLVVYDVRVQGEYAAGEVVAAIERVQRDAGRLGIDAMIVTRGGGSLEDLWAFNERAVAAAIHASAVPVVAAIGHESDTTIAELVADLRASTPTQAAMRLVPDRAELAQQVDHLAGRLAFVLRRRLERARERTDALASRPVLRDARALLDTPRMQLERREERLTAALRSRLAAVRLRLGTLDGRWRTARPEARLAARREHAARLETRLHTVMRRRLDRAAAATPTTRQLDGALRHHLAAVRARLERQARGVALLDPSAILGRGFTYTTRADDGALVRGPADAPAGRELITHARDGRVRSIVAGDETPAKPTRRRRATSASKSPPAPPPPPSPGGLFGADAE
jgi:exodeoxyribonuclease VII large subunit